MSAHCRSYPHARGFTIVELLVAIILFATIMLVGMTFFSFSSSHFSTAKNTTFALSIANTEMENLKTLAFNTILAGSDAPGGTQITDPQTGLIYVRIRTVEDVDTVPGGDPEYKIFTVSVNKLVNPTWHTGVELVSIRARD